MSAAYPSINRPQDCSYGAYSAFYTESRILLWQRQQQQQQLVDRCDTMRRTCSQRATETPGGDRAYQLNFSRCDITVSNKYNAVLFASMSTRLEGPQYAMHAKRCNKTLFRRRKLNALGIARCNCADRGPDRLRRETRAQLFDKRPIAFRLYFVLIYVRQLT